MQATAGLQKHLYNPRIQPDTEHTGHASAAIGTARFAHRLASSRIFLMRSEPEVSASRRAFSCLLHCCISDFMSLRAFSYSSLLREGLLGLLLGVEDTEQVLHAEGIDGLGLVQLVG